MAEQRKEIGEYNSPEWINNRRINYTIIRMMWDAMYGNFGICRVRGCEDDRESLTGTFEISKYKWDAMIAGTGKNSYGNKSQKLFHRLEQKTGIPHQVFTGEERICLNEESFDKALERRFVNDEDDENYSKYRNMKKKIFQSLKNMEPDYDANKTLFLVWYFIKYKVPYIASVRSGSELIQFSSVLQRIQIKYLKRLSLSDLQEYQKILKQQLELVSAVIVYKLNGET